MTNTINRQKVKTIPLTDDLKTLRSYILLSMRNAFVSLEKISCAEVWLRLAKLTLCRLILFNKRRRAEVKDLKVKEFEFRPTWQHEHHGEFEMALSTSARMLAKRMDMVISAGKSRKNVDAYVILPHDAKAAMELLNSTRMAVGISSENPFLFARLNSNTPLSGNGDLKEIVAQCPGIQHPERITSTGLRRYIATVSQILDMSDNELDSLARHLGHDVQTHRNNYRLSHATRELTVVSQLLMAVDDGCVNKWKGKQLKDISVEELPDIRQFLEENESDSEDVDGGELPEPLSSEDDRCLKVDLRLEAAADLRLEAAADLRMEEAADHRVEEAVDRRVEEAVDRRVEEAVDRRVEEAVDRLVEEAVDHQKPPKVAKSSAISQCKRSVRRPWSAEEEEHLKKKFKFYLEGVRSSVHNEDMIAAQQTCDKLSRRTLAQIRVKLNNMKLGKSR